MTMEATPEAVGDLGRVATSAARIGDSIETVIEGKPEVVRLALTVLLAEGHLLIEDVPGVGKTMLAKALARSIDCSVRRIQFTPDLLPSDITGVSVYNQQRRDFEFKPGAIFANIVVGDEINRASPKTQSALLESMEERQVTIDGRPTSCRAPFMVVATQNPIEMEGTYPLPEAQRDRFMARRLDGLPRARRPSCRCSTSTAGPRRSTTSQPVADAHDDREADRRRPHRPRRRRRCGGTRWTWSAATRTTPDLRLGASPRATAAPAARGQGRRPRSSGRDYALPDDVQASPCPVLAHRLLPTRREAQIGRRRGAEQVVGSTVLPARSAVPRGRQPGSPGRRERRSNGVRARPRGLTTRGRSFLAAGSRRPSCAVVLGQQRPAAGRPAARSRCRWSAPSWCSARATGWPCSRRLAPPRVPAGSEARVPSAAGQRLPAAHRAADAPGPRCRTSSGRGRGSCWTGWSRGAGARSRTASARTCAARYPIGPLHAAADRPVRACAS